MATACEQTQVLCQKKKKKKKNGPWYRNLVNWLPAALNKRHFLRVKAWIWRTHCLTRWPTTLYPLRSQWGWSNSASDTLCLNSHGHIKEQDHHINTQEIYQIECLQFISIHCMFYLYRIGSSDKMRWDVSGMQIILGPGWTKLSGQSSAIMLNVNGTVLRGEHFSSTSHQGWLSLLPSVLNPSRDNKLTRLVLYWQIPIQGWYTLSLRVEFGIISIPAILTFYGFHDSQPKLQMFHL